MAWSFVMGVIGSFNGLCRCDGYSFFFYYYYFLAKGEKRLLRGRCGGEQGEDLCHVVGCGRCDVVG